VSSRRPAVIVASLLALTILSACTHNPTDATAGSAPATPAVNATTAPALPTSVNELPTMDVAQFHTLMRQLKGTPVVVNVWGAWCAPCRTETPLLVAAARSNPGVQFLGVDVQDSFNGARDFLRTYGVTYPSVFDPTAAIKTDLGALGQPDTYFYGASGSQVAAVAGPLTSATLRANLAKATASS
jgi:cytochrome c biogenesis protein CcmG, thiol:disulfide interchange protein DsbE